jgi:type IV pilus assembly protein PilC
MAPSHLQERPLSLEEFLFFNRQLASMARLDLPISSGLKSLAHEVDRPRFRILIENIQQNMEQGLSLHQALEKYPNTFSRLYLEILKAGEGTGNLATVLDELASYAQVMQDTKTKIINALVYPIFVGMTVLLLTLGILYFAVPQFESIFVQAAEVETIYSKVKKLGEEHRLFDTLPFMTRIVISASQFMRNYHYSLPFLFAFLLLSFWIFFRIKRAITTFEQFIFKFPVFGKMFTQVTLLKTCKTLADLLRSGVSIIEALSLTRNMTGNNRMGDALEKMRQAVENGERMSETCRKSDAFPESLVWKLTMAEERGIIEDSLEELANYYEKELTNTCTRITNMMQPVLLVVLAVIVGGIVISLYLPLFSLTRFAG